ncbi:NAD(P)H-dependent oxidoreductase [Skeletonema marinoi]|uniref:NAD(P)H-dependent oxidoreductase n=1 Tax=Skeletonema marinoi TaxID=267567 RepID=A0AAD9D9S6_9STRA|nr:NAD(P)H-dependent oxidoreductase [Skeletonema marinoi]|mmetsp:Transcript_26534/g.53246  ORF Transcript_26534/g.53246 Transcript_26534/m.53246 type:complete len:225 (+) Transcript_26534:69-743(+)
MTTITLKTIIFLGSARNITPPWGGDSRLGDRVIKWVKSVMESRKESLGADTIAHDFRIIDPIEVFGPNGALSYSGGELSKPTFFMDQSTLPAAAKELQEAIKEADCYLVVSPEYNHSIPPALSSVMGHFGGSNYKCKPSGIITYSPGVFGGIRAAMAIQVMLHELGCLPVSKLCGVGNVSEVLNEDGKPIDPNNRLLKQLPELLTQLEWMAVAMANQRKLSGTF